MSPEFVINLDFQTCTVIKSNTVSDREVFSKTNFKEFCCENVKSELERKGQTKVQPKVNLGIYPGLEIKTAEREIKIFRARNKLLEENLEICKLRSL